MSKFQSAVSCYRLGISVLNILITLVVLIIQAGKFSLSACIVRSEVRGNRQEARLPSAIYLGFRFFHQALVRYLLIAKKS